MNDKYATCFAFSTTYFNTLQFQYKSFFGIDYILIWFIKHYITPHHENNSTNSKTLCGANINKSFFFLFHFQNKTILVNFQYMIDLLLTIQPHTPLPRCTHTHTLTFDIARIRSQNVSQSSHPPPTQTLYILTQTKKRTI